MSSPMTPLVTVVGESRDRLGESPLWDGAEQALYWIDSLGPCIHRLDPATGARRDWEMPSDIGSIGLSRAGKLLAGLRDGFYEVDLRTGGVELLHHLELPRGLRLNDGKMDRQGRYISGTLATKAAEPNPAPGTLYRLWPNGRCDVLDTGMLVSNATCFSPAGDFLYFADSREGVIRRYRYDGTSGAIGPRENLIDVEAITGSAPDGATVDSEGRIWVALVHTAQLGCFDPAGTLLRKTDLPVELPSCPAFGGPNLDQLYITSISDTGRMRSTGTAAGALLRIDGLGVTGIAEARFDS